MKARRRLVTAADIVEAKRRQRREVHVSARDIVTPEARDTAFRLSISLTEAAPVRVPPPRADTVTLQQRGLWRRSPRWMPPRQRTNTAPDPFEHVAFVGVGGVGLHSAQLAATAARARTITLIDVAPGRAEAHALDLLHATGVTGNGVMVRGGTALDMLSDANVVVVSAGMARRPGMARAALRTHNQRVIQSTGEAIALHAPQSVVIVVTNPLEAMTARMLAATGFSRTRVLGMAGTLDSARLRATLASVAGVPVAEVRALVLGSHDTEMTAILSRCRIRDRPVDAFLTEEQTRTAVEAAINAGQAVVNHKRSGSAVVAPAHAVDEVLAAMQAGPVQWLPVSLMCMGEYGISGQVAGVPCLLDRQGVAEVIEIELLPSELAHLRSAVGEG